MGVSPRALAIRLVLWSVLFIWAVYKLHQFEVGQIFVAPPAPTPVELTGTPGPTRPDAPPLVDPEAAMTALEAVKQAMATCGAKGTVSVRLGAAGIEGASFLGEPGDLACTTKAVWGAAWPAGQAGFEVEGGVGG